MSTPPNPYGQSPYGQQPPTDQPPYGQAPYGQPQYGQQQYGQPAYGQPQPVDPAPPQVNERKVRWMVWITVALAVFGLGYGAYDFFRTPKLATVGSCMTTGYTPKRVDCSSSDASYVVLKRYDVLTSISSCSSVPGSTRTYNGKYRQHFKTRKYILCLGPHGPGAKTTKTTTTH